MKARKDDHFPNGLISEMRDLAKESDTDFIKKSVKESKKAKVKGKSLFSKLSPAKTKKLLSMC